MGGVASDDWGRTSVPGLYAAGEVACTGVHGANRLASNSLLEGLVFGARAAIAMQQPSETTAMKPDRVELTGWTPVAGGPAASPQPGRLHVPASEDVRDLMWERVGLFRTREGLQSALSELDAACEVAREMAGAAAAPDVDAWRSLNLVTVARLIARAALRREESRGGHFRQDLPERDDINWKIHVIDQPLQP
jgi:L-aspartate oxidase